MSFEQVLRIGGDRVGVLVGREGRIKQTIEERCGVELRIDSETGEVTVRARGHPEQMEPFKAVDIVTAIGRGFSPERAFRLLEEDASLQVIDLRDYVGKSHSAVERIKGRIIGLHGKSRRLIEELTGAQISVYGHTVTALGDSSEVRLAVEAIEKLASGSAHRSVYEMLQRARTRAKLERVQLWEGAPVA